PSQVDRPGLVVMVRQQCLRERELGFTDSLRLSLFPFANREGVFEDRTALFRSVQGDECFPDSRQRVRHQRTIRAELVLPDVLGLLIGNQGFLGATEAHQDLASVAEVVSDTWVRVSLRELAKAKTPVTDLQRFLRAAESVEREGDV